jgi:hypothetical protein
MLCLPIFGKVHGGDLQVHVCACTCFQKMCVKDMYTVSVRINPRMALSVP